MGHHQPARQSRHHGRSRASAPEPSTATQTIDQARQLIDLIASDDLRPVIVLDDTDRWLSTSYQPDNPAVRSAVFGRVVRILAEDLGTAATTQTDDRI
ncbi:hypothetical protein [Lapillicoccus sp.]|uniref:hypothetical protein n=1 Tax=Lapillicoccus sp. TaxID=1909287 RepID=UPI0025F6305D|nr:hypothetical protein [Lapillicoccus sp.]